MNATPGVVLVSNFVKFRPNRSDEKEYGLASEKGKKRTPAKLKRNVPQTMSSCGNGSWLQITPMQAEKKSSQKGCVTLCARAETESEQTHRAGEFSPVFLMNECGHTSRVLHERNTAKIQLISQWFDFDHTTTGEG